MNSFTDLPGLWGTLLGVISFPAIPVLHAFLVNVFSKHEKHSLFMFLTFGVYLVFLSAMGWSLLNKSPHFEWELFSLASTALFFMLGYMELYSMVARGFSLNIIKTIYRNPQIQPDQIGSNYADGLGVEWLLKKRLSGLAALKFISIDSRGTLTLLPRGLWIGKIASLYKSTLRMGKGG
jgi:hypothetical protein